MSAYDVVIVGGGIIGGSIAFELGRQKLRVAIVEKQAPGLEASWAAAGMLVGAPETPDSIPLGPLAKASLNLYGEYVAAVEEASGRSVGYRRDGALLALYAEQAERELSTILAIHHGLGFATEAIPVEEARQMEGSLKPSARAAAWLPNEGSVNSRSLTEAVLAAAKKCGAEVVSKAGGVTEVTLEKKKCAGVTAGGEKIGAARVIIAAGCFSGQIEGIARLGGPTQPVRGQMVALQSETVRIGRVVRSEKGYLVPQGNGRVLAGSTSEHAGFEKRVTPAGLRQILAAAVEIAPGLEQAAVVETWSGLRPDTPDHLPSLGPTEIEGLLMATGHYRNGILLAPITAKLLGEWVTKGKTSLEVEAFSPLRFVRQGPGVRGEG
jgi:glycine oxidase